MNGDHGNTDVNGDHGNTDVNGDHGNTDVNGDHGNIWEQGIFVPRAFFAKFLGWTKECL